jgi:hypothetical protein
MSVLRQRCKVAVLCAAFAPISLPTQAQTSVPQSLSIKADAASLCAMVGKQQVIVLKYGYDPIDAEPRELEPYAVGYTRKHVVLLFARQVKGYSKSAESGTGDLPGWRNFRIDKIRASRVNALTTTFEPIRPSMENHRLISEFACTNEVFL